MGMCECEIGFLRIKNRGQMLEILLTLHGSFTESLTQLSLAMQPYKFWRAYTTFWFVISEKEIYFTDI